MLLIVLLLTSCNIRRDIKLEDRKVDPGNFPDEVFREYVSENFDIDKNGILSIEEIEGVNEITILGKELTNLDGVEYFVNLLTLNCYHNNLKSLDVSYNSKLEKLLCEINMIEHLDLRYNMQLIELKCDYNNLEDLDISHNLKLKYVDCNTNKLSSLDVSNNTALTFLDCTGNPDLKTLYLQTGQKIEKLYYDEETTKVEYK